MMYTSLLLILRQYIMTYGAIDDIHFFILQNMVGGGNNTAHMMVIPMARYWRSWDHTKIVDSIFTTPCYDSYDFFFQPSYSHVVAYHSHGTVYVVIMLYILGSWMLQAECPLPELPFLPTHGLATNNNENLNLLIKFEQLDFI